eukprot:g4977.t1
MWQAKRADFDPKRDKNTTYDATKLFDEIKNKEVDAIIEYVRDGSSYRVVLLETMSSLTFNLAGVACPRLGRTTKDGETASKPDPFASEAKHFVEVRLLHRRVNVRIKTMRMNKTSAVFIGEIIHPKGDIATEILKRGLGHVVDWSVAVAANRTEYYAAEKSAKERKLRKWRDHKAPSGPIAEFEGSVVEIVSGDTLVVLNSKTDKEERVSLASIRTRRMGSRGRDPEPFAAEAREH